MNSIGISIIVPTLNEAGSITRLTERIDAAMRKNNIEYEIIFIDDHSVDRTVEIIKKQQQQYPVAVASKEGKKGKAFSLLEGFQLAKYPVSAMIDADLQYPPEAIPKMYQMIMEKKPM